MHLTLVMQRQSCWLNSQQAKLVRVVKGTVLDVVVDMRKNSPTFSKHFSIELSRITDLAVLFEKPTILIVCEGKNTREF